MGNEQAFGQGSGDCRSETEVLVGPRRRMGRERKERGVENKRPGAQGDGEVRVVGSKFRGGMGKCVWGGHPHLSSVVGACRDQ